MPPKKLTPYQFSKGLSYVNQLPTFLQNLSESAEKKNQERRLGSSRRHLNEEEVNDYLESQINNKKDKKEKESAVKASKMDSG
ncbi:11303_t:CDS:2 [Entrophospora sp. SA101]|nr:11303_t:CDS:2 [Entrophospora sp. SA101]